MKKIAQKQLKEILEKHLKWINNIRGGIRANLIDMDLRYLHLRGANLCGANLYGTNLRCADLYGANLSNTNLCGANLYSADLRSTDLRGAYLSGANLREADLQGANLQSADLYGAYLEGANLDDTDLCGTNLYGASLYCAKNIPFIPMVCPEEGSFIGYKKARGYIVKLEILAYAKRSSATTRKCRCSKAKVLSIENLDGTKANIKEVASSYNKNFIYKVDETVEVKNFDEDRWNDCSTGIHFFINRQEAVDH